MDLAVVSKYIEAMTKVLKDITPRTITPHNEKAMPDVSADPPAKPVDTLTGQRINVDI